MSFLGRFRILTKILSIIMLLSGVAGTLAYLGVCSMKQMNESAETISRSAKRLGFAALATQNVIALSRAEFRSALDPRDENRLAARKVIEEELATG